MSFWKFLFSPITQMLGHNAAISSCQRGLGGIGRLNLCGGHPRGEHRIDIRPALLLQTRGMSKYLSKSAKKRLPLTTKRAHKGFYKGKGGTKEGRLTSKGNFIVDPRKRLELVVPDLTGFKLKPYIAAAASRFPPQSRRV